ncbi:alpha/beta hydrolase-fold protein [Mariniflexile litorale]|uniref:Alpha/beta hydrolase-fold protein n=1 Tax=Mariniflexile litorale TaxID=3045158 RepID=A0AAU7EIN4_9FLAO|nr:alpha/beta hydrolase-fold protein [Mariniflexile sp. KMM 9835]MDQ8210841.1 alpha/beta hydrolase-fold protein [Mariniflexile sp. KMM 9835]
MKLIKTVFLFCLLTAIHISNAQDSKYTWGEDSNRHENIPKGTVAKYVWKSTIFEGTIREYFIYVPAQYKSNEATALMVFQDGHAYINEEGSFRAPIVFDNLIYQKEMPVTIGLFINPGDISSVLPEDPFRASNRSIEYDSLNDDYIRFLMEELIPEISKTYNITTNPKMRAICGLSSGAICAFTAAWERPDYFNKVMSHIGSFTNIRGGHNYEAMIRETPKKNIKVYLQDGSNDLNNEYGNWWLANLQMASSLEYMSYDYMFVKGDGAHNGKHGGSVFPEALKWLWSDFKKK